MTDLHDQLQASLGGAYAIERELGGGGMSRVFVAEELALGRRVVVKVLPAELSGGLSMARFRREISLAARLQHPHIVPLFSAGEVDGQPYYTMPFVDGESLRARLTHGELPIAETLSVLRDVARALAFAHGKGIAHRDIKPDNVLLSGTSAVITDFGVAKAVREATTVGDGLTSIGIALGTPAYMAPEQGAGDPATDVRADIYAFGVMAYELLAGHLPFAGRNTQAILAAHATEVPRSIAALRPATPAPLADLVMWCLEKRPGDRPQSAEEIVHALDASGSGVAPARAHDTSASRPGSRSYARTISRAAVIAGVGAGVLAAAAWWHGRGAGTAESEIHSIAVLPFENTSGDTTFAYLEDGIADQVRDVLNAVPALTVKARGSSRQLKGRDAREVGRTLGVDAVLQGTVSPTNARLHVTAELVRVSDDVALWSRTFDGRSNELVAMQDTIARATADRLHVGARGIRADPPGAAAARGTADVIANASFLRGRFAADHLDWPRAISLFQDATKRDPGFARAHAYLAISYANAPTLGLASVDSMNALAQLSAARALALDSTIAEAYVAEANVRLAELRYPDAVARFAKAVALDSTNADILWAYGSSLLFVGRVPEGLTYLQRARALDPLSSTATGLLSYALELSGRDAEAVAILKSLFELDPGNVLARQGLGFQYVFLGQPDSAVKAFETAYRLGPTLFGRRSNLVFGYAAAGRWKDAARERALLERDPPGNSPHTLRVIADLAFGEWNSAMTELERSFAAREAIIGNFSVPCDPLFDPLKRDPRFDALMRHLGAHPCPVRRQWPIHPPPR